MTSDSGTKEPAPPAPPAAALKPPPDTSWVKTEALRAGGERAERVARDK